MSKFLIVGGVAGGATAAARLRRIDEKSEIVLIERGDYISYANCGLPYYSSGVIADRSRLFVMTAEKFKATLDVEVRTGTEAIAIDRARKSLTLVERASGRRYEESYDALLLSPGAEPIRPPLPGIEDERIFTLRSVPDVDRIKECLDARRPERAIVVGAGFIGLEMAENLAERGVFVTIVEALDQAMAPLDFEMAALVHEGLKAKGVELYLGEAVSSFERSGTRIGVTLKSGKVLPADMVLLSIGVRPDTKLARDAGLDLDERGAILVDDRMRTSDPAIYAVGDAVAVLNPLTGKRGAVPLAGPANKEARVAADAILGDRAGRKVPSYPGSVGASVAKVFDLTVAAVGLNEKNAKRAGLAAASVIIHPSSHAGYYPGAKPLSLKIVFDPKSGRLLGAQAVGYEGVEKRVEVLSAFIQMGGSVSDLARFEQCYAPPFSSAKDPVNYAGFVAEDILGGLSAQVSWAEVRELKESGAFILDVRTRDEFELGRIEGAVNIPNTELRSRLAELPKDRFVLVYCGVGIRGYLAERILRENGWTRLANLSGGYKTWAAATATQSNGGLYRPGLAGPAGNGDGSRVALSYAEGSGLPEGLESLSSEIVPIDACGLQCPGPIMRLKAEMDRARPGATLLVRASDPGFARDSEAWCRMTGNEFLGLSESKGVFEARIRKASSAAKAGESRGVATPLGKEATLVVFSDDFDRALASFVIANGAAASGKKVTMFFTFWGLSVIKRRERTRARKDLMGRLFGAMLPRHSGKLSLSKMNFGGLGPAMMRGVMAAKKIAQLEEMMAQARASGVHLMACQMSMDIMGVKREELIDGVEIGGVATYLEATDGANLNLFV